MGDAILNSSHLMDGEAPCRMEPLHPYELPRKCKYETALSMYLQVRNDYAHGKSESACGHGSKGYQN